MKNFEKKRGGSQLNFLDEIIVDNFAGGGGASTGMELATGRPVAIAINHDPDAILMHRTNHPYTEHLQASVWDVDPREVCRGRPVGLAWFSPDCKHFSKAKGAALVDRNIRGLAWIVLRWAGTVRPRVIILENVEEFVTWVYGDNVIEKHGINRDRTGDREKTRYLCGKQGIFTRDRALIRPGSIRQLETRASTRSASFFHALGGPTTAAALLGHIVPATGRNP